MSEPRPFHRVFGLSWSDFFHDLPMTVEREVDLSLKQQLVDLVLVRQGTEPITRPLPDGFEDLAAHNLVTFKSYQEALTEWSIWELIHYWVGYRKQVSPALWNLLPETNFRLFAVCVRYPQNLAEVLPLTPIREGVYEVRLGTLRIRVIVVNRLPLQEQNARLLVFSPQMELLRYGRAHFQPCSPETSTLLYKLFLAYSEDPDMAEQMKEFVRQTLEEMVKSLPAAERLKGLSPEERLEGLPAEERLKGLSPEQRLAGLSPEELEALAALIRQRGANGTAEKPQ